MPAEKLDHIDYRALRRQVRERRRSRRTIEHKICLDSALIDEWAALSDQHRREVVEGIGRDPEKPDPNARAGDLGTAGRLAEAVDRMDAASVLGVFVVPTPETLATWIAEAVEARDADNQKALQVYAITSARRTVLETFDHFRTLDGKPIPAEEYGAEDLKDMLEDWTRGQLIGLATAITDRGNEVPDLPLSGRRSQPPQP